MELKVLISVLQEGGALKTLLADTKSLTTALTTLQGQAQKGNAEQSIKKIGDAGNEAAKGIANLNSIMEKAVAGVKFLAGGFLALESVRFIKDLADTAARAEVLATVLHVVGFNAGYSVDQLDKADRQIQALGITATASRQALTQFIQAQLDLTKAPELARAAQDAAVILGVNSSEAFSRLVTAVQTSNTLMLRHMGIIVQAEGSYSKYAAAIGKTAGQLTTEERHQAFLNATLEEAKKIQGSYEAAMGDVGKQLTSLDRLTENLKESLGKNLLPAYLAVVQELSLVLEQLKLTSDGMYEQGEGAKTLGENVRELVKFLHDLLDIIIKFKTEILGFVGGWILLRYVMLPVVEGLKWLVTYLGSGELAAGAGILGRIAGAFSLLGATIIIFVVGMAIVSERFRMGLAGMASAVMAAAEAMTIPFQGAFRAIIAALQTLRNIIDHPFDTDSWKQPWIEWEKYIKDRISGVKDWWDLAKVGFSIAFPQLATPEFARGIVQSQLTKTFEEEAQLLEQITRKTQEYNDMTTAGSTAMATAAKKELDVLNSKAKTLHENRMAAEDALKYSKEQRAQAEKDLETRRAQIKLEALATSVEEARKGAKFGYGPSGEIGVQFGNQLGQFNSLLRGYTTGVDHAGVATAELVRNLEEVGAQTKTRDELVQLKKAADDLLKTPGLSLSETLRARQVSSTAALQVAQAERQRSAAIVADQIEKAKEITDIQTQKDERELANLKTRGTNEQQLLEFQYKQHLVLLDDYYDARIAKIRKETDAEVKVQQDQIAAIDAKAAIGNQDPKVYADLAIQKAKAVAQIAQIRGRGENEEDAQNQERITQRNQLVDDLRMATFQQRAQVGGITAEMALLNEQLEREKDKYAALDPMQAEELTRLHRLSAEAALYQKYRDQALQVEMGITQAFRDQLDQRQQGRDLAGAQDKADVATGKMTENQARVRSNDRIRQEMADNELKRLTLEKDYALQAQHAQESLEAMKVDKVSTAEQITLAEQKYNAELLKTQTAIAGVDKAQIELAASIESTNKQIRDSFVNSWADALNQMVFSFNSMGKILADMAKTISQTIIGIFTKAFAEAFDKKFGISKFVSGLADRLLGLGGGSGSGAGSAVTGNAGGGLITGPGTGTSDSIPAMLSTGEHVMPASKTAQWLPLLEGIRLGRILPAYALGGVVSLQSIAMSPIIPRRYAAGGMVSVGDAGASNVMPGGGGAGNMVISLHPDAMNLTLREWLEQEVVRQQGRR
jgi:uncharacterized cupredoxin-like copper-binding protein